MSCDDPLNDQRKLHLLIPGSIQVLSQRLPVIIKGTLAHPKRKQIFSVLPACLRSKYLGALRGPVHFHTEVIPVLLPMEFAVYHVEQVAYSDLLPGGELHQGHPRRDIFVFRDPKGNYVSSWGPGEVTEGW